MSSGIANAPHGKINYRRSAHQALHLPKTDVGTCTIFLNGPPAAVGGLLRLDAVPRRLGALHPLHPLHAPFHVTSVPRRLCASAAPLDQSSISAPPSAAPSPESWPAGPHRAPTSYGRGPNKVQTWAALFLACHAAPLPPPLATRSSRGGGRLPRLATALPRLPTALPCVAHCPLLTYTLPSVLPSTAAHVVGEDRYISVILPLNYRYTATARVVGEDQDQA